MINRQFRHIPRMKAVSLCLLAVAMLAGARAGAQEYSFRTFTSAEGLGNLSVQKIYQDRAGFLWVSTENGIFRYDGNRFESFGPAEGMPEVGGVAFAETADGRVLVGANIGLFVFAGNRFEKVATPFKTVNWTQGIAPGPGGEMYVGTELGLYRMTARVGQKGFGFERIYPTTGAAAETIHGVLVDGETIWFGCGIKLCQMRGGAVKVFGEESGLPAVPMAAVVKDRDGNVWVRARNEGVLEWPAGETKFRRPDTPVPGRELTGTPALDRDGRVLLGTPGGLLAEDARGWQLIDRRDGLRGGAFATFEDRHHDLWIGTGGRGLAVWRGYREWESYTEASGLPNEIVYELAPQADGTVWAGTEAGLIHGEPRGFGMTWKMVEGTRGVPVHSLQMDGADELWIGSALKGVGRVRLRTERVDWVGAQQGLTGKLAFTIRFDRQRQLWAATESGVFVAKSPYVRFARITELPASWFWTVAEGADGTIWAGGQDGLFALDQGHWQHWKKAEAVVSVGPGPDGSVWVGYQHGGGIDRIRLVANGAGARKAVIEKGVQRPGTNGLIYFLDFDHLGRLWAGTERGVDEWDGAHWSHYGTSDGLVWEDLDLGGFAAGPDGTLWFGTSGGLSRFKPRVDKQASAPPGVVFTQLRVGDADVFGERNPSFARGAGALTAKFAAPDAPQDSSLAFRYRLEGANASWTETPQRQLEFAKLAPGKYRLEVQVRDRLGVWSDREAVFAFAIRTPWYLRAWFIGLLILIPVAGATIVARLRSAGARKREMRLQRIVDEKTSDLRKANEELLRLTMLDSLTGLANRRRFDQALAEECERLQRSDSTVSLIILDVDHFKALNDSSGHQKGDEYLVTLGRELMRAARRRIDLAARIGGEEFALILPATDGREAERIAEGIRHEVEALKLPHPASPTSAQLTVSVGVATATRKQNATPEELVAAADQALYQAKKLGRDRVEVARA